jgi:hypothetical protein
MDLQLWQLAQVVVWRGPSCHKLPVGCTVHKHVHITLKNGSKTNGIPIRVILRNRKDTGILLRIISKLSKVKINVVVKVWTRYQTSQHSFLENKLLTIKYHNFSRY